MKNLTLVAAALGSFLIDPQFLLGQFVNATNSCSALPRSVSDGADTSEKPAVRGIVKLTEEALKIHREALLVDGHNDLPWQFRRQADLSFRRINIARPQPLLHTDIERLRKGGVGAQFWAAYVDAESKAAVKETLEQIDVIHRIVKSYPDTFAMAY